MKDTPPALPFPHEALERLAELIVDGDVVFFAGAGFSIDVEKNTAVRLIRRLLIRLYALTSPGVYPKPERKDVRAIFAHTFLPGGRESAADFPFDEDSEIERARKEGAPQQSPIETPFPFDKTSLSHLASRYYEVNDWFVNTFGYLLRNVKLTPFSDSPEAVANRLMRLEALIQESIPEEPVALEPIDPGLVEWAQEAPDHRRPGKALFLDTLGFRNEKIMRGQLQGPPPGRMEELSDSVERLFHGALLPRHRVIARFAREGWCPTTITTNYDMLLEGAYRLAGFTTKVERDEYPRTRFDRFARIASPVEFFTDGKALREPVLLKMHGCAERYRSWTYKEVIKSEARREEFKAYLKSMVFTYREIQNWRQDSWAADFLRTQLRTRTMVFSGYSLQDPVIHDTFRTVYEEMGKIRQSYEPPLVAPLEVGIGKGPRELIATDEGAEAPAFFFAPGDQYEFYGLEVLRAASSAVGVRKVELKTHPNYLRFHFRGGQFPDLDEQFMWLYHRAVRLQQIENLKNHLRRISSLWLGKPRPEDDLRAIEKAFSQINATEVEAAKRWSSGNLAQARREFQRITAWTDILHPGLLREFACGDLVQRHRGPGTRLARLRRTAWYFPVMENPLWSGWATVVEIALRRMAAAFARKPLQFFGNGTGSQTPIVAQCDRPTLLFADREKRTRHALTIHYAGFGLTSRQAPIAGAVGGRTFWELRPSDARWYSGLVQDPFTPPPPRRLGLGNWSFPRAFIRFHLAVGRRHAKQRRRILRHGLCQGVDFRGREMNLPDVVGKILREKLHLAQKDTLTSLLDSGPVNAEPPRAFFVAKEPAQLLIDGHLKIQADAVIHDGLLGSLGLVHRMPRGVNAKKEISRFLDEAIFLRHLLIEQAGTTREVAPYFVEVVFLLPTNDAKDCLDAFFSALRELVETSTVINAIGVNLWRGDATVSQTDPAVALEQPHVLRRAFSWMLRDVQHWLGTSTAADTSSGKGVDIGGIESLELRNFRVAGKRTFQFPPSRSLHVIHGYNGSGKTATAEALEFALTGTVSRVQPVDLQATPGQSALQLIDVLRHQGSKGKPEIIIKYRPDSKQATTTRNVTVGETARPRAEDNGNWAMLPHPGAFRLNQALADQLMFHGPVTAATTILEAFFPTDRANIQAAHAARRDVDLATKGLPPTLTARFGIADGKLDVSKTKAALTWLAESSIPWETLREYLPVTSEQARSLEGILGSSFTTVYSSPQTLPLEKMHQHLANALDPDFQKLMGNVARWNKLATQVVELLENLRPLTFEVATDQRPLGQLLTQWLERAVRYDLADREDALLKTIGDAPEQAGRAQLPLLGRLDPVSLSRGSPRVSELLRNARGRETILAVLRQDRDRARTAYQARQASTDTPRTQSGDAPRAVEHDLSILDEAAQLGLFGPAFRDTDWLLSEAIRQAQRDGTITEVVASGEIVLRVGAANWTEALRNPLRPVADTLQAVIAQSGATPEQWPPPSILLLNMQKTAEAVNRVEVAEKGLVSTVNDLFSPTGRVLAPLNELIALLTPQRWTYQDLVLRPGQNAQEQRFDPHTGDTSARLILNTAEQNAFALSLFLLCARLQPNALKLIILDDPFQNMDEFTVTGVARGLTRLLRLWRDHDRQQGASSWQILILIHSIENLDRLRSETSCSILTLPWAKPMASENDAVTVQTEPLADFKGLQRLSELITSG